MKEEAGFLKIAKEMFNLQPGMGLGTQAWNPMAGIEKQRRRRAAEGLSARELMDVMKEAGVNNRDGVAQVLQRAYEPVEQTFMRVRGR